MVVYRVFFSNSGLSNCFTLTTGVQQDLSEFLLPAQSDLLAEPSTTSELESDHLIPVVATTSETATNNNASATETTTISESSHLQELTLPHLEQLDTFLENSRYLSSTEWKF